MGIHMSLAIDTTAPAPSGAERLAAAAPPGGEAIAIGVAVLSAACLVWAPGKVEPLPALGWAAAFLLFAVHQDVRSLRIPNWLTFPSLVGAIALGALEGGLRGAGVALAGAAVALAVGFVPFALRWLGAGDVKAGMVLAALWGAECFLGVFWWMLVVGGLIAVAFVAVQGGLLDLLSRWLRSAHATLVTRRIVYFRPAAGSAAARGLPFAIAMALGATAFQLWGTPWN
jgi:prepilin peptidase CpaA